MLEHDTLKMYVRFYDNHAQLKQVKRRSGVPLRRLRAWLDGGILADVDRKLLWDAVGHEKNRMRRCRMP